MVSQVEEEVSFDEVPSGDRSGIVASTGGGIMTTDTERKNIMQRCRGCHATW